ncbi:MAG: preprotein translocase subunit SecA [Planctomycetaceae bacterium]
MIKILGKIFIKLIGGTRNERLVRSRLYYVRQRINPLEEQIRALSPEALRAKTDEFKQRFAAGESRERIKPEAFAVVREASRRAQNHRQFDVQLVAGMVLDEGAIAEEATGEGKTIACYPAMYMAVLEGLKVHLVTHNDYLVRVGADFATPIMNLLGVSVGFITADMPAYGPEAAARQASYACDITYGTNSEYGFDFLRDNMKMSVAEQVQGRLDFAIIDEVDSILIDEARTPLIISGPAYGQTDRYRKADAVAREVIKRNRPWDQANKRVEAIKRELGSLEGELGKLKGDERKKIENRLDAKQAELEEAQADEARHDKLYEVQMDKKSVHLTHEGVSVAQDIAGVGSFYVGANMEWPHLMQQSLQAHLVYELDKDYVVRDGTVVIVDQFTGRLMEGREWSDGLHQAVEAKEHVTIKEENQTLATITLQNFFKLYKKLAGMTGTAMTEAGEFRKIYKLDVITVPTHRPVNRVDHEDRIYAEIDSKFDAVVEEIHEYSMKGRPVLVGTTSIEKSEHLSTLLQRRYGIEHRVLNGRIQDALVEGEIVKLAGLQHPLKKDSKQMVGNVTIATNMAGRGTDIKLGQGVVWENCKVPPAEKLTELGVAFDPLYPPGVTKCCINCQQYNPATDCAHCFKPKIDKDFPLRGRTDCRVVVPCGLHIVATERHEARRIDNQLRGRAGRQGDPGSSRFFLSLRDELLAIFAGEWTLKVLGWLGLQGQEAIEHPRVSKGIERAQKKVEERNFDIRKNLLEYDEVMDFQRRAFYSQRQRILEGRDLEGLLMDMIAPTVSEGVANYLDPSYHRRGIAEWAATTLQINITPDQVKADTPEELPNLEADLRRLAKDEAVNVITTTLGEYMDEEADPKEWDLRGLSSWAMSRFGVQLSQNQLRKMQPHEVDEALQEAAAERIDKLDISEVERYLKADLGKEALVAWAADKFSIAVTLEELGETPETASKLLIAKLNDAYRRREIEYPVEYALDMTVAKAGTENVYALKDLVDWANAKYEAALTVEELQGKSIQSIHQRLVELSRQWNEGGRLEQAVRAALGSDPSKEKAIEFAARRFGAELSEADFDSDIIGRVIHAGRTYLRREMTELERYVFLQIYDSAWKDHLLAMDHLKSGIGLRGYAEQDPRVAYKREGSALFNEMMEAVRDRVSSMIFKVRLAAGEEVSSVYQVSSAAHEQLAGFGHLSGEGQRAGEDQKVLTIRRDEPKVGRNDPCPCGSGKKYKKCHGIGKD